MTQVFKLPFLKISGIHLIVLTIDNCKYLCTRTLNTGSLLVGLRQAKTQKKKKNSKFYLSWKELFKRPKKVLT